MLLGGFNTKTESILFKIYVTYHLLLHVFCNYKPDVSVSNKYRNLLLKSRTEMYVENIEWWRATVLLTLYLLTWKIWWATNNARKRQMGFNSAFEGLMWTGCSLELNLSYLSSFHCWCPATALRSFALRIFSHTTNTKHTPSVRLILWTRNH